MMGHCATVIGDTADTTYHTDPYSIYSGPDMDVVQDRYQDQF